MYGSLLDTIINVIVFLISFLDSLRMCRKTKDTCVLALCFVILLNLSINSDRIWGMSEYVCVCLKSSRFFQI